MYGEAGSVNLADIEPRMAEIRSIAKQYPSEDIYNVDETGLYWKRSPNRTLDTQRRAGRKVQKARITVMACTNATGSDRAPFWIISTAERPRAFAKASVRPQSIGFVYKAQAKAWVDTEIFREWLLWFDNRTRGRKVLLLLDNFIAHENAVQLLKNDPLYQLQNTRIEFLPANSTSYFQPLDQGIIANLKCYYKKKWLEFMLQQHNQNLDPLKTIDLVRVARWLIEIWEYDVQASTINTCFRRSTLFGPVAGPSMAPAENDVIYQEIGRLIQAVEPSREQRMDVNSFLNPEEEKVEDTPEDDLAFVISTYSKDNQEEESDDEVEAIPRVSHGVAIQALYTLRLHQEQQEDGDSELVKQLTGCERQLRQLQLNQQHQQAITHYFETTEQISSLPTSLSPGNSTYYTL